MKVLIIAAIFVTAVGVCSQAQTKDDIEKYDKDGNHFINDVELTAIFLAFTDAKIASFLTTDGAIDQAQINAEVQDLKLILVEKGVIAKVTDDIPEDKIVAYYDNKDWFSKALDASKLLIRSTDDDVTLVSRAQSASDAEAALFSVNRNYISKENGFVVKGALIRPIKLSDKQQLVPAIIANHVKDTEDSTNNVNSLTFRLGYSTVIATGKSKVQAVVLKVGASYATDFDWNSKVYAASFDGYLIATKLGIGLKQTLPVLKFLKYRFNIILHSEYGVCKDKGDSEKLVEDEDFFRLGAKGTISLTPTFLQRLDLTTTYTWLPGLVGSPDLFENFSEKATFALDTKKRFSLTAEYNKGKVPLKLDEVNNLLFGISVKL